MPESTTKWQVLCECPRAMRFLLRLRWIHPRADIHGLAAAATAEVPGQPDSPRRTHAAARAARSLVIRLPRLFRQPCLYSSLAALYFLRRGGLDARMHVGVRAGADDLESHAWVTVDGVAYFDDPVPQGYVDMLAYPRDDDATPAK